jgi:transcriptional regulator with XRE-family HTH domain
LYIPSAPGPTSLRCTHGEALNGGHYAVGGTEYPGARRARGLSQWQLAERSGLSADFIDKIKRGLTSQSIQSLHHIAEALRLPLSDFFAGDPSTEAPQGALFELIQLCRTRPNANIEVIVQVAQLIFQRLREGDG